MAEREISPGVIADFGPRVLVTVAALAVYRLAGMIPLPGVEPALLETLGESSELTRERLSIGALGLTPVFSVVLLAAALRLMFPGWVRSMRASREGLYRSTSWLAIVAVLLAAFQALGFGRALQGYLAGSASLVGENAMFVPGVVFSLTAATALFLWLGSVISRQGLGHGFVLLLAAPAVAALPGEVAMAWERVRSGQISEQLQTMVVLFVVAQFLALVWLWRAHVESVEPGSREVAGTGVMVEALWVALLGRFLADNAALFMSMMTGAAIVWLVVVIVPVFVGTLVWVVVRRAFADGRPAGREEGAGFAAVAGLVYGVLSIMPEVSSLMFDLPFALGGGSLLIAATAALCIVDVWRQGADVRPEPSRM